MFPNKSSFEVISAENPNVASSYADFWLNSLNSTVCYYSFLKKKKTQTFIVHSFNALH